MILIKFIGMDSGLLGIIMALLLAAISGYSSYKSAKKKRAGSKAAGAGVSFQSDTGREKLEDEEEEDDDEFEDIFSFVFKNRKMDEENPAAAFSADAEPQEEEIGSEFVQDGTFAGQNDTEEGVPATVALEQPSLQDVQVAATGRDAYAENQGTGNSAAIRERIKQSPKDLILFSEILNPKFKEL